LGPVASVGQPLYPSCQRVRPRCESPVGLRRDSMSYQNFISRNRPQLDLRPHTPVIFAIPTSDIAVADNATDIAPSTYAGRRVVTDSANRESIEWVLDFVKPEKLHISRTANGKTDQWIKIGETRYHASPPSLSTDSPEWERAEQTLVLRSSVFIPERPQL